MIAHNLAETSPTTALMAELLPKIAVDLKIDFIRSEKL